MLVDNVCEVGLSVGMGCCIQQGFSVIPNPLNPAEGLQIKWSSGFGQRRCLHCKGVRVFVIYCV